MTVAAAVNTSIGGTVGTTKSKDKKLVAYADNAEQLMRVLESLSAGNTSPQPDEYCYLSHYVSNSRQMRFPCRVWKHERPDFLVECDAGTFGVEMTSVISEPYMENIAEYKKHGVSTPFVPMQHRRVNVKYAENLKMGLSERGSAIDRGVGGLPQLHEILEYLSQIDRRLEKKSWQTAGYEIDCPIDVLVGIESTVQHRYIRWSAMLPSETMIQILRCLTFRAYCALGRHPKIRWIGFLSNRQLLGVSRATEGLRVLCGGRSVRLWLKENFGNGSEE